MTKNNLIKYVEETAISHDYLKANNIECINALIRKAINGADLIVVCDNIIMHVAASLFKMGSSVTQTIEQSTGQERVLPEDDNTVIFKLRTQLNYYSETNNKLYLHQLFNVCYNYLMTPKGNLITDFINKVSKMQSSERVKEKNNKATCSPNDETKPSNQAKPKTYTFHFGGDCRLVIEGVIDQHYDVNTNAIKMTRTDGSEVITNDDYLAFEIR